MKIFNLKGWLIRIKDQEETFSCEKMTTPSFCCRYLFYIDKPQYLSLAWTPPWDTPHAKLGCEFSTWIDSGEAIHIELTKKQGKELGLPITPLYHQFDERETLKNLGWKLDDPTKELPPYGRITIENNQIKWKPLSGKKIHYLSKKIVENKIEEIFQKYCFEHKENNWIVPRDFPDIIKDVKERLFKYMEDHNWLRKSINQ